MIRRIFYPIAALVLVLGFWQLAVDIYQIPKFVLPSPSAIFLAFVAQAPSLLAAAFVTLKFTLAALAFAIISGVLLALFFSLSSTFETTFYPFAVVLQVTPVISIAPLVIIWVGIDNVDRAAIIIAWLAAFFPILANMSAGLRSVDKTLEDLFLLYGANRWQRFWLLEWPTALPFLMASLKISSGLALIGAVVAEFVAGSGSATGIAWRILEAGHRLQIETMFAGLLVLSMLGVGLFYFFDTLEKIICRRSH